MVGMVVVVAKMRRTAPNSTRNIQYIEVRYIMIMYHTRNTQYVAYRLTYPLVMYLVHDCTCIRSSVCRCASARVEDEETREEGHRQERDRLLLVAIPRPST